MSSSSTRPSAVADGSGPPAARPRRSAAARKASEPPRSRACESVRRHLFSDLLHAACDHLDSGKAKHAKHRLRTVYLSTFPPDKLDAFFAYIDGVEEQLALAVLEKAGQSPGDVLRKLSRAEIYAVLTLVASPTAPKLHAALKQLIKLDQLPNIQDIPAGLFTLGIDDDPTVRAFAARQLLLLKPLPHDMAILSAFQSAFERVRKRYADEAAVADWSLLSVLINNSANLAASLTPTILSHVHDRHDRFTDVLKAYSVLLKLRGPAVWFNMMADAAAKGTPDDEYPTVILSGILDNTYFTKTLFDSSRSVNNRAKRRSSSAGCAATSTASAYRATSPQTAAPSPSQKPSTSSSTTQTAQQQASRRPLRRPHHTHRPSPRTARQTTQLDTPRAISSHRRSSAMPANLVSALEKLSALSARNNSLRREKFRGLQNAKSSSELAKLKAASTAFYDDLAKLQYPALEVCSVLWREVYNVTGTESSKEGASILLAALARIAICTPPTLQTHIFKPLATDVPPAHYAHESRVRQSIASILSAFRSMRRTDFAALLADFGEFVREDELQQLCTSDAYSLLLLNLCPDPDVYKPAQNLLRQAFSSVESRADCFRILFQINHTASLRACADYLPLFINATVKMVEANDLAKWMVRSFADIVEVLAGSTDGLLRPGTSWTLVEDRSTLQAVALKAPTIWRLMCESVASIFKRTPAWSNLLPREEMVAWFRDVTIFASEMVEALAVFRNVVRRAAEAPGRWTGKSGADDGGEIDLAEDEMMVRALALPLESATSWLRMNDEDILRETHSFILKALDQFGGEYDLPTKSKTKMLGFINEQMAIKDASARHTLLSLDELADLKVRLDPDTGVIEISDEDEDTKTTQSTAGASNSGTQASGSSSASKDASRSSTSVSARTKTEADNSHWWAGVGNFGLNTKSQERRKNRLKQSKLSFAKVDPKDVIDIDSDERSTPASAKKPITLDFTRPKAAPAPAPSAPINAYRGAAARGVGPSLAGTSASSRNNIPTASTGKMAQLRQELGGASRNWKPQNVNVRSNDTRWGRNHEDDVTVKAPAAVSSVTGALINKMPGPTTDAARAAAARKKAGSTDSDATTSSSSSSESSDDETEAKGLAALRAKPDRPPNLETGSTAAASDDRQGGLPPRARPTRARGCRAQTHPAQPARLLCAPQKHPLLGREDAGDLGQAAEDRAGQGRSVQAPSAGTPADAAMLPVPGPPRRQHGAGESIQVGAQEVVLAHHAAPRICGADGSALL
ncbi:hypothetical protein L1887_60493 [Cichorium endivia]|nr:hypothetical protein L1887_60493 [Cichorium endivia]